MRILPLQLAVDPVRDVVPAAVDDHAQQVRPGVLENGFEPLGRRTAHLSMGDDDDDPVDLGTNGEGIRVAQDRRKIWSKIFILEQQAA